MCVLDRSIRMFSLNHISFGSLSQGEKGEEERVGAITGLGVPIVKSLGPDNGPLDSYPRVLDSGAISLQQRYACVPCSLIHYAALLLATYDII